MLEAVLLDLDGTLIDNHVVGDTVYDVDSARKAGLPCVCVLSGGIEREVLAKAGAAAIYVDAADVAAHLDAIVAPPASS